RLFVPATAKHGTFFTVMKFLPISPPQYSKSSFRQLLFYLIYICTLQIEPGIYLNGELCPNEPT
ncbi:MAG: hypothetical protein ACE5I1_21625, partial [bacterium]